MNQPENIPSPRAESSRTNGALSRGPVSEEGKQKSARNSQRHGMLAQTVVLNGESEERFLDLLDALVFEYKPRTEAERSLVDTMAVARWRHLRLWGIQKAGFEREMDRHQGPPVHRAAAAFRSLADSSRALDLAYRYETSFDRQFLRSLKRLEELRARPSAGIEPSGFPIPLATATFEEEPAPDAKFRNEPSFVSQAVESQAS